MEDKSQYTAEGSSESLSSTLIPIALALVGIALGGLALYFSLTSQVPIENRREVNAAFESQLRSFEAKLTELKDENETLETDILSLAQQTQVALEKISNEFSRTREEIASIQARFRPQNTPPVLEDQISGIEVRESPPLTESPPIVGAYYTIQAGDTFAKIARELGLSIDTLIQANPRVDPRKLQIGQKIIIPAR